MKLALRELARRPARFVTAVGVLSLIALLLVFLGGLLDGLIANSVSAVKSQRADVIVFSAGSQDSFLRSRVDPDLRRDVTAVLGVEGVGGIGVAQLGARVPGKGGRDLIDIALFGYETPPAGVPAAPRPGQAYADATLRDRGVEQGTTIRLGPARTPIEVIGFVSGTNYLGQGALWSSPATWRSVLAANRPDETVGRGVFQALVVSGRGDPATLARTIDVATRDRTHTLTVDEAVEAIPGVKEQRGTFNQIIGVTVLIAVIVVALFFVLLTVERTGLYGVLKAVGARSGSLLAGVLLQAVSITLVASILGVALSLGLAALIPAGAVPIDITPIRIATSVLYLLFAATVGSAFSLRRVLRIDPASAIGGSL